MDTQEDRIGRAVELIEQISVMLKPENLSVRGAVLASLLSEWVIDHPDGMMLAMLEMHLNEVADNVKRSLRRQSGG